MFPINNPGKNILRHFEKAKKAEEGETRDWKGGKFRKQAGKWVEVTDPKQKKEEEPGGEKPSGGGDMAMDKHEVAQLALMKDLVNTDSTKAYEVFQSLSPEAQSHVPQDVVTKLVKENHKKSEEGSDVWENAGKEKKAEGKGGKEEKKQSFRFSDDKKSFQESVSRMRGVYDSLKHGIENDPAYLKEAHGLSKQEASKKVDKMEGWFKAAKEHKQKNFSKSINTEEIESAKKVLGL